jgi:hypothetical protein
LATSQSYRLVPFVCRAWSSTGSARFSIYGHEEWISPSTLGPRSSFHPSPDEREELDAVLLDCEGKLRFQASEC